MPKGLAFLEADRLVKRDDFAGADRLVAAVRVAKREAEQLVFEMNPLQRQAMQRSIEDAFRYIWLHEISHVIWGHVDLSSPSLDEVSCGRSRLAQTVEQH